MKVVGLVGPKRSGKDTAAAALVEQRGYVRVGFADAVKEMALRINPIVESGVRLSELLEQGEVGDIGNGWEYAKNKPEVRRFLQALGTDAVRGLLGDETWLKAWHRKIRQFGTYQRHEGQTLVTGPPNVVVPDVRFLNEAAYLLAYSWEPLLIRVVRPGLSSTDTHVSEIEQTDIRCDVELINDGTPEQLHAKVLATVDEWSS